jgi:hypothetical protein
LLIFLNFSGTVFLPLPRELARGGPKIASKNKTKTASLEVSSCNQDPFDFEPYLTGFFQFFHYERVIKMGPDPARDTTLTYGSGFCTCINSRWKRLNQILRNPFLFIYSVLRIRIRDPVPF